MDKPTLRRWGRDQRRRIDAPARVAAAREVVQRVLALDELARPTCVLMYAAAGAELPTAELRAALHAAGHRVGLPRIADDVGGMTAIEVVAGMPLVAGPRGVPAPPEGSTLPAPEVVLTPGVVFCPDSGARVGQGGGYYDRYLERNPGALAVGLAFDEQCSRAAAAVAEPHDRPVQVLLTPSAARRWGRRG